MERRRLVLLLHGVGFFGSMGEWQRPVARILGPHFRVVEIKYPQYRWLGFVSLVLDLRALLIGGGMLLLLQTLFDRRIFSAGPVVILLSVVCARLRYGAAIRHIVAFAEAQAGFTSRRPHVIAHSLGTHLVGTILRRYPDISFGQVVLAGCVLPSDYQWDTVLSSHAVESVRNDVGRRDLVPRIAHLATRLGLLRGFGSAGWSGFDTKDDLVHTIDDPEHPCEDCHRTGHIAPIHNVINKFGHSGVFTGGTPLRHEHRRRPFEHAAFKWLPYLWDMEPPDYLPFLRYCSELARTYSEREDLRYSLVETRLLNSRWGWTHGMTLADYVYQLLQVPLHRLAGADVRSRELVPLVMMRLWIDVQETLKSFSATNDAGPIIATVDPRRAIYKAIASVVRELEGVEAS